MAAHRVRTIVRRSPMLTRLARQARRRMPARPVTDSAAYWEARYRRGGRSGAGSYGRLARFKAEFLNDLVRRHGVTTVLELGCGDGNQLSLADYPHYVGVDVSGTAIRECRERFAGDPTKEFVLLADLGTDRRADLVLSLDVIYHLVEDDVFEDHVRCCFGAADRFVVLYTSTGTPERDRSPAPHVRHRPVPQEVARLAPGWELVATVANPFPYDPDDPETSFADFLVFGRTAAA